MKIFKENKTIDFKFDFVSLSVANLSFIILSFFALNIPKKEKGILFAFEKKPAFAQLPYQTPKYEVSNYIKFSINDKGEFFVEDEPVKIDETTYKLKNYLTEDSTRSIYIIIHQDASYEYLIKAFDITIETFKALKLSPKIYIGVIKR
jgi:biopolymer transport protein ExbD